MAIANTLKELTDQLWEPDRESADLLDRVLEDLHRGAISDPQVRARIKVSYSVRDYALQAPSDGIVGEWRKSKGCCGERGHLQAMRALSKTSGMPFQFPRGVL